MSSQRRFSFRLLAGLAGLMVAASVLTLAGCRTMIPPSDTEPPEVRLTITGPGLGSREMSNPPRDNWTAPDGSQLFELEPDVRYNFIVSVSDSGGVQRAHFRMPDTIEVFDVAPAEVVEATGEITRSLTLTGNRSDPRTGLVISGSLEATRLHESFAFHLEGDDFGGASGSPNQTFMSVIVFTDD